MPDVIWTVKRILEWIEGYLAQHGDENPRLSSQWLVSEALGISRMQLFLDAERPLSHDERATLRDWTRRRGAGEPLQYITGETAFRHITVKVRPGVLIPRPETEVLVSEALALLPPAPKPQDEIDAELIERFIELGGEAEGFDANADLSSCFLVADICTGSGCIACSIAYEHPMSRVFATDLSPEAVSLARANVELSGVEDRVRIIECDLGEGITSPTGSFDLVVSNPPYVPSGVLEHLPREVSGYEPDLALDGGPDGLAVFRRLLTWSSAALKPGGGFACELFETTLESAASEAASAGFTDIRIVTDLSGRPRILTARKSPDRGTIQRPL